MTTGLALLIFVETLLIDARNERSESLIREKLLRVQGRLTGVTEAIAQPHGGRNAEG